MDGWTSRQPFNGTIGPGPRLAVDDYIKTFKMLDNANIPATINLLITADVTRNQPFFNLACVDVMRQARKAVKDVK